ncbi:uncharacterized protein LOC128554635 [Mercenaria mercenaria]|uniref:uncharacterized protein LOC128554635 n=1 Tax=Mercenaria mercenaria TaxID=6596 RepID=UPI00234E7F4D|nr:uncharacterized protein LOC128554635 [Mercenaria mercenaria]
MARNNKKDLSRCISNELNLVGFNREAIRQRVTYMDKISKAKDLSTKKLLGDKTIQKILVGSRRDGTGLDLESDYDILQIYNSVMCIEDSTKKNKYVNRTVLHLDKISAPAGYTFLTVLVNGKSAFYTSIEHTLTKKNGKDYVSSDLFMSKNDDIFYGNNGFIGSRICYLERKGPSIPTTVKASYLEQVLFNVDTSERMDFVRAFPCKCGSLVNSWCERRRYKWPSQKTIERIRHLPMYVVPVGKKGSKNEDFQWRISFIMAEIHLIKSFNNTQIKVLVLLKLIKKHILKPVCEEITTYVIKNVMFWICEANPPSKFRQKHLLSRLTDALKLLKTSVQNKDLKCYMIPEQNLLEGKINDCERETIVTKIDQVLSKGQELLYKYFRNTLTNMEKYESALAPFAIEHYFLKAALRKGKDVNAEEIAEYEVSTYHIKNRLQWIFQYGREYIQTIYRYGWEGYSNLVTDKYISKYFWSSIDTRNENHKPEASNIHTEHKNVKQDQYTITASLNESPSKSRLCIHKNNNSIMNFLLPAIFLLNCTSTICTYKVAGINTVSVILHIAAYLLYLYLLLNHIIITKHIKLKLKCDRHYPCVLQHLFDIQNSLISLVFFLLFAMQLDISKYILKYPVIFRCILKWIFDYLYQVLKWNRSFCWSNIHLIY